MKASARIEVARIDRPGREPVDVVVDARSEPPVAVRRTPGRVLLVGSAAAPVGGDEIDVEVVVGPGSCLVLGTAAATIVWPARDASSSTWRTRCRIGGGGRLVLRPEPTVVVRGARHRSELVVEIEPEASLLAVDEVSLGRTGEEPGTIEFVLRVERAGLPLVHHVEHLGPDVPGWGSAALVGWARHLISVVVVGVPPGPPQSVVVDGGIDAAAWMPVADDAAVLLAVGADRPAAWALVDRVVPPAVRSQLGR